jgi:hypothetical protein
MTLREAPTLVAAAGRGLVNTRPTMQSDAGQNDEIKVVFVDAMRLCNAVTRIPC